MQLLDNLLPEHGGDNDAWLARGHLGVELQGGLQASHDTCQGWRQEQPLDIGAGLLCSHELVEGDKHDDRGKLVKDVTGQDVGHFIVLPHDVHD